MPERDPAALADALQRLLADPPAAARMAEEGRRRVAQSFDMKQTVAELAQTLKNAVAAGVA